MHNCCAEAQRLLERLLKIHTAPGKHEEMYGVELVRMLDVFGNNPGSAQH